MNLWQRLTGHARFQPDKPAIEFAQSRSVVTLSYRQLQEHVEICCDWFASLSLQRGDRLAILALNHPDWFVLLFAAARCGVVLVPLNWRLSLDELQFVIDDSEPTLLFHDAEHKTTAKAIAAAAEHKRADHRHSTQSGTEHVFTTPAEIKLNCLSLRSSVDVVKTDHRIDGPADAGILDATQYGITDPLLVVYTSGTTGRPKGAVLSEQAVLCSALMSQHMFNLSPADRVLNVLPLFHVGGLNIQPLPTLLFGGTVVLHARFDPRAAVVALDTDRITLINSVPTLLQAIIAEPAWKASSLSSLRAISIGSTDVPISLIRLIHERGIPLLQVYGATETSPVAIYQRIDPDEGQNNVEGSIGRAGLLCDIRLTDEQGHDVAVGDSGEIRVRGENVLSYYWNNPEATQQSLHQGWFRTGDVAHCDERGDYWFDDRLKHVVISGGENIYPAELERVILAVPGVQEVSVVGKPHQRWGEVPVAVVAAASDVSEDMVLTACQSLARFKQPKSVVFVDELPRNALGKIVVAKVRELLPEN